MPGPIEEAISSISTMATIQSPQPSPAGSLNRRQFLEQSTISALGMASFSITSRSQEVKPLRALNRFPRMVQEYFVDRVRSLDEARTKRIYSLSSRQDAVDYVSEVRQKIRTSFGPNPPLTPLNPQVTRVIDRGSYRIENVIFESRPGFLVTANLYVPNRKEGQPHRFPGVIGTCGHSRNGKAEAAYQSFAQGLAKQGYIALIYDPIGQGERLQYLNGDFKSRIGVGVGEHLYAGNQQFLIGEFIGMWRAWDGIRALDYLLTREELDPQHLGITGNSGGGTMTTWLAGLDQRYTMAAPSCFVTSFRRNLENELPADTEQCPPRALALGLDHEDFLVALAPKPVKILAKERDYFDVRGSETALARLRHIYRLLGAEQKIALFTGPTTHGYSIENREAMYQWFNQATKITKNSKEPSIEIETDETLQCTPRGQVAHMGAKPIYEFTKERAAQLQRARPPLTGEALKEAVNHTLGLTTSSETPPFRILRRRSKRGFPAPHFTSYAIETEPGIQAITYLLGTKPHDSRPQKGSHQATLYISDISSDEELRHDKDIRSFATTSSNPFYACDVRGSGESQPDTCGENSFLAPYGSDYFCAIHSLMLDDPYPAQKARDVIQVIRWLEAQGHTRIHLIAQRRGSIPASIAALLSPSIQKLTLKNALPSFQSIAESEDYDWPLSSFIPNVLKHYDLPDIYAAIRGDRELEFIPG